MGAPPDLSVNFTGSDKISWDNFFFGGHNFGIGRDFRPDILKVTIKAPYKNNKGVDDRGRKVNWQYTGKVCEIVAHHKRHL